ncbi:hypothetical protein Tsubulata_034023 [Turnera subulata]|uniref:Chloride channel protein n=1 Tax=Turnera subulata TaxID=218843 RepID=A0A9Q0JE63_9ROSI|nr:hypothetical protein Tsubulata_034023 [Turnera subulata]
MEARIKSVPLLIPSYSSCSLSRLRFSSCFGVKARARQPSFFYPHPRRYLLHDHKIAGRAAASKPNGRPVLEDADDERGGEEEEEEELDDLDDDNGGSSGGSSYNWGTITLSCLVGTLTGIGVVVFNNGVHEIRDLVWDGIPYRGASWLREEALDSIWARVILVPACGGFVVSILNHLRSSLEEKEKANNNYALLPPLFKTLAACFTLGTGNSLGPEGPSVEIGASIAKALASRPLLRPNYSNNDNDSSSTSQAKLSLLAAGSAAGIASGFNAAVAGCFFAVESVLWPSPKADSSMSLTNTTSMVILSAVIASVGLGSEPAFKVPDYDFRSPSELPLYLLLGILCGLVSLTLSRCTTFLLYIVDNLHKTTGIARAVFPVLGGLAVGMIALAYPEILYWGFENVDILLESRPFVKPLSADLLVQLVGVKIVATSLCRASGLVGGYYAPSLFIGAATGMAYGKLISSAVSMYNPTVQLSLIEVASPQAYGLVGMAATLAGVCQVPLTAVLLLFELTQDYRIVLPLLGAVGLSSWITSGKTRRAVKKTTKLNEKATRPAKQRATFSSDMSGKFSGYRNTEKESYASNLCDVESSLCIDDSRIESEVFKKRIFVSEAMRTRYVTVLMNSLLTEAVTMMLAEKQSCAIIVDEKNILIGLLTLRDIEQFSKTAKAKSCRIPEVPSAVKPSMDLLSAEIIMDRHGVSQVPVVSEHMEDASEHPIGLLDTECINVTCRALATKEALG